MPGTDEKPTKYNAVLTENFKGMDIALQVLYFSFLFIVIVCNWFINPIFKIFIFRKDLMR